MKILTVCQRGNVRSTALARILKDVYSQDALCCGLEANGTQTLQMLFEWAEKIILLDGSFEEKIPEQFRKKLAVWDIGDDKWGNPSHPELQQALEEKIRQNPLI